MFPDNLGHLQISLDHLINIKGIQTIKSKSCNIQESCPQSNETSKNKTYEGFPTGFRKGQPSI